MLDKIDSFKHYYNDQVKNNLKFGEKTNNNTIIDFISNLYNDNIKNNDKYIISILHWYQEKMEEILVVKNIDDKNFMVYNDLYNLYLQILLEFKEYVISYRICIDRLIKVINYIAFLVYNKNILENSKIIEDSCNENNLWDGKGKFFLKLDKSKNNYNFVKTVYELYFILQDEDYVNNVKPVYLLLGKYEFTKLQEDLDYIPKDKFIYQISKNNEEKVIQEISEILDIEKFLCEKGNDKSDELTGELIDEKISEGIKYYDTFLKSKVNFEKHSLKLDNLMNSGLEEVICNYNNIYNNFIEDYKQKFEKYRNTQRIKILKKKEIILCYTEKIKSIASKTYKKKTNI